MDNLKIKTKSGFEWEIDPEVTDDMELIDQMAELFRGNDTAIFGLVERILTKEGKDALYEHCRNEKGRVPASAVMANINEIFTLAATELKKSQASQ